MVAPVCEPPSGACAAAGARAVACVRRNPAALLRLVCFSHAGGGPAAFRRWPEALAPDVELWAVTLPGRSSRAQEPCATCWPALVEDLAIAVRYSVAEPFALFGHSLGGLLAFEVARELSRGADVEPSRLIVSACVAPHMPRPALPVPDDDEALVEKMQQLYDGIPGAVRAEPELLAAVVPILRADIELACGYRFTPGAPLRCPISALGGESDPSVSLQALQAWSLHTSAAGDAHMLPGGHFYMEQQPVRAFDVLRRSVLA